MSTCTEQDLLRAWRELKAGLSPAPRIVVHPLMPRGEVLQMQDQLGLWGPKDAEVLLVNEADVDAVLDGPD